MNTQEDMYNAIDSTTSSIKGVAQSIGLGISSIVGIILVGIAIYMIYNAITSYRENQEFIGKAFISGVALTLSFVLKQLSNEYIGEPMITESNSQVITFINNTVRMISDVYSYLLYSSIGIFGILFIILAFADFVSIFTSRGDGISKFPIILKVIAKFGGGIVITTLAATFLAGV